MVELYISKEGLMELVDYDREEAIRLEEVNVIYSLSLFRKIPSSFILFPGLQLWVWFWHGMCINYAYASIPSLSSFALRNGVCIRALPLLEVARTTRCYSSFHALCISPALAQISSNIFTSLSVSAG